MATAFLGVLAHFEQHAYQHEGPPLEGLAVLMATSWPVLPLLCVMARGAQGDTSGRHGYQYKPYALDFEPAELLQPHSHLSRLRSLSCKDHLHYLRIAEPHGGSTSFIAISAALRESLKRCDGVQLGSSSSEDSNAKLVVTTMLWGERHAGYLRGILQRAQAFNLHGRYLVFCLDGNSLEACQAVHPFPEFCISGQLQTIYNKFTMLASVVQLGFDALYVDLDTLLLADPLPHLRVAAQDYEVLVGRDLGSECLNTGVIYVKAHPDVAGFLASLLVWLWHHPYEFSQKAFSAFLGHEVATDNNYAPLPIQVIPRWTVLDPRNAFVTSAVYNLGVEGWVGNLEDILIFHFLDGTGGVDPDLAIQGKYVNLYELFYENPELDLANGTWPLWEQDPRVELALLRSRLPEAPAQLLPCAMLPDDLPA